MVFTTGLVPAFTDAAFNWNGPGFSAIGAFSPSEPYMPRSGRLVRAIVDTDGVGNWSVALRVNGAVVDTQAGAGAGQTILTFAAADWEAGDRIAVEATASDNPVQFNCTAEFMWL